MAVNKTSKTTAAKDTTQDITKATVQTTLKVEEPVKSEPETKVTEATTKKTAAKKTAEKTPAKRTTAKKTTTKAAAKKTTRRTATKKTTMEVKADVFVQFRGMEYSEKQIMEKVVAAWEAEGKKATAIKRAKLYVKPEDGKAYYVINEGLKNGSTGAVNL